MADRERGNICAVQARGDSCEFVLFSSLWEAIVHLLGYLLLVLVSLEHYNRFVLYSKAVRCLLN